MRTVIVTTSRKKHRKWSNSSYFAWLCGLGVGGEKEHIHLTGKKDYNAISEACKTADALILAMPVYVDGIPANVLKFLGDIESQAATWNCKVYVVTNCGFFEGEQCSLLLRQVELWCESAGLKYGGGIGIGGGEMLGVLRLTNLIISPAVALILFLALMTAAKVHSAVITGALTFGISVGLWLIWSSAMIVNTLKFGRKIRGLNSVENKFTTLWCCGRPLFEFFANLFWIIRAMGNGIPFWKMK